MKQKFKRIKRRSGIVCGLLLVLVVMAAWISDLPEYKRTAFDSEEVGTLSGSVYVECNGKSTKTVLPAEIDASAGDTIVIRRKLGADALTGNTLMYYARQADTKVWLDDELLWEDPEWDTPFPMLGGSYWRIVKVPSDYAGRTLRLEIVPEIDKYARELPTIYTGEKQALIYMVLGQGAVFLILGMVTIVLGAAILVIGLCLRKHGTIAARMYYLGLFSIVTGVWGSLEARATQIFTGNIPRATFVVFACFALLPVVIMAFILTYESLRGKWYMKALFYLAVVNFVVQQVLQIAGIAYYIQMVNVVHILFILIMLGLIAGFIGMQAQPENKREYFIYKALLILAVFGMADIVWYCIFPTKRVGTFLRVGILFFIAYLGYDTIRQIGNRQLQEAKDSFYKELAFTDIMTGLENRTAFEHTMASIRSQQEREKGRDIRTSWIIMMVDMNCLKIINDEYGHDKGDEAIFRLASGLKTHFGMVGECFRIGGDEFCVLAPEISMERFEQLCEEFRAAMETEAAELSYPFSASLGYVLLDESGADECLKKADARMYAEKRSKGQARR